jgi:hypothetical protein
MRKRFEQQMELGVKLIEETPVRSKSRDDIPAMIKALLLIYTTSKYNEKIFKILEDKLVSGKKVTGRPGLTLWQIFVLAQFRLALDIDYDRLDEMVSSHSGFRQLLGIENNADFSSDRFIDFSYDRIVDNIRLLDDQTLKQINQVIVEFGHGVVFKKKEAAALCVKSDSYVVESMVHFPTDYNLLWDCSRKSLDTLEKISKCSFISGWRKIDNWKRELKNGCRALGKACSSGGANKEQRVQRATEAYLSKAKKLSKKTHATARSIVADDLKTVGLTLELNRFVSLLDKHIDLVERRLLKAEKIPHSEKMFSIFEDYTEWVAKGKKRPSVELGKKVSITTDQYGLIIDHQVMEHRSDSQIVIQVANNLLSKYQIQSWSFDKGYYHKANKEYLKEKVAQVIMPKKGKRTAAETIEETTKDFKTLKNKHSAVESNINELEHCGLNRCPDKGYHGFKRYISIGITAYNLKRIGRELLKQERERLKKERRKHYKTAA